MSVAPTGGKLPAMNSDAPRMCMLKAAVGEREACPDELCAFWAEDGCAITGLHADLGSTPDLAGYLLRIREALGGERSPRLYGVLPPGLR
jgi:hypothetical protein